MNIYKKFDDKITFNVYQKIVFKKNDNYDNYDYDAKMNKHCKNILYSGKFTYYT